MSRDRGNLHGLQTTNLNFLHSNFSSSIDTEGRECVINWTRHPKWREKDLVAACCLTRTELAIKQ